MLNSFLSLALYGLPPQAAARKKRLRFDGSSAILAGHFLKANCMVYVPLQDV
jgi:hypothetical protein